MNSQPLYRRNLYIWVLFCLVAGGIFLVYASISLHMGQGDFLMPLDDVYIHFQYARQLALGQPYVYNPGQPPTSGATSFLYPFVLAAGYLLGFQGLKLGLWAMLVGMVALACSQQVIYRLVRAADAPEWLSIFTALLFALTGAVAWHYMSGMETGLICLLTLWTLYTVVTKQFRAFMLAATLLALIRPEGSFMAVIASGMMVLRLWTDFAGKRRQLILLIIPLAALSIQPVVNLLVTGSAVASGNQSKSIFGMVPFIPAVVIDRVSDNFLRIWREMLAGSEGEIIYLPLFLGVLGLISLGALFFKPNWRSIALMLLLWMVGVAAAVATLDTAFWHFKRYQMPIFALIFPLSGWLVANLRRSSPMLIRTLCTIKQITFVRSRYSIAGTFEIWFLLAFVFIPISFPRFATYYAYNVGYVYAQPLQMARWLAANTPEDATVAVHDTGMMRYMSGRTTFDIVGLTTPGAADYWRNGPGAVAEFIMREQPDYIASYGKGHGYGLALLADTSLYGEPLAAFPVTLTQYLNVALAADFQGIYQPDYAPQAHRTESLQTSSQPYLRGFELVDSVNVGDVRDERDHAYSWYSVRAPDGFPTDVYEIDYLDCATNCRLRDGGRRINGGETFTVNVTPNEDVILVTRVNAMHRVEYNVYANGEFVGTRFIPQERGRWLDIPTLIPAKLVTGDTLTITTELNSEQGDYLLYYHLVYQGRYQPDTSPNTPLVTFQDGAIALTGIQSRLENRQLVIDLDWYTEHGARGDYAILAHVYPEDTTLPLVAQTDRRPGNNALPPGNWLPGSLHDTISIDLVDLPPGLYQPAIGLYHPVTFERLLPTGLSDEVTISADGRVFIGAVELKP